MKIPGINFAREMLYRSRVKLFSGTVILAYHRVCDSKFDPQILAVTPANFEEHLQVIQRLASPLALSKFTYPFDYGNKIRNGVIITFDDGYDDFYSQVLPLLAKYDIPATVFITSGYIDNTKEFYWDELEHLLFRLITQPLILNIQIKGQIHNFEINPIHNQLLEDFSWNVTQPAPLTSVQALYKELCSRMQSLPELECANIMDQIRIQMGTDSQKTISNRVLSSKQIEKLSTNPLVNLGAHTSTHPKLSSLSLEQQFNEIKTSKSDLENIINRKIISFAYPYGTKSSYSTQTPSLVKQAGFAQACSNFEGLAWRFSDPYQLPRFLVRNWDGDTFTAKLHKWVDGQIYVNEA
jgi:peptidoglycan/xylan/chitin deacetylase (PgdA/CDA1 family)